MTRHGPGSREPGTAAPAAPVSAVAEALAGRCGRCEGPRITGRLGVPSGTFRGRPLIKDRGRTWSPMAITEHCRVADSAGNRHTAWQVVPGEASCPARRVPTRRRRAEPGAGRTPRVDSSDAPGGPHGLLRRLVARGPARAGVGVHRAGARGGGSHRAGVRAPDRAPRRGRPALSGWGIWAARPRCTVAATTRSSSSAAMCRWPTPRRRGTGSAGGLLLQRPARPVDPHRGHGRDRRGVLPAAVRPAGRLPRRPPAGRGRHSSDTGRCASGRPSPPPAAG